MSAGLPVGRGPHRRGLSLSCVIRQIAVAETQRAKGGEWMGNFFPILSTRPVLTSLISPLFSPGEVPALRLRAPNPA